MPCSCQGKSRGIAQPIVEYLPDVWGPPLWKLLHLLASKLGNNTNSLTNNDMANSITYIITKLPFVLPCRDCQAHAKMYLLANKFDLQNHADMRNYVENYLFQFHNTVRTMLGKPLIFTNLGEMRAFYASQVFTETETNNLIEYFTSGVFYRIVNREMYVKWRNHTNRLRLLTGV